LDGNKFTYTDSAAEINASIQAKGARWFAKETPLSRVPSEEMKKWTGAQEDTASGKYLLAVIDPDNTLVESNEKNNVIVSGTLQ
jgi:hypothetical protein